MDDWYLFLGLDLLNVIAMESGEERYCSSVNDTSKQIHKIDIQDLHFNVGKFWNNRPYCPLNQERGAIFSKEPR